MTTERTVQRQILLETCDLVRWFRNNVGIAEYPNGTRVAYGVGGKGGSDLLGVVRGRGQWIACEVKTPFWRPGNQKDRDRWELQQQFLAGIRDDGGLGIVATSPGDVRDAVAGVRMRRVRARTGGVHYTEYPYLVALCGCQVATFERTTLMIGFCETCRKIKNAA